MQVSKLHNQPQSRTLWMKQEIPLESCCTLERDIKNHSRNKSTEIDYRTVSGTSGYQSRVEFAKN